MGEGSYISNLSNIIKYIKIRYQEWLFAGGELSGHKFFVDLWDPKALETFAHLLVAERLQQLRYLTNRNDSTRLIDIKRLCKEANNLFNSLNESNEWNIPQKHCVA